MRALLIRCYPARWRARYGEEFAAILEERPLGPFDVFDILLAALDARLRMRGRAAGTAREGFTMSLRIGGVAAILGATLLAATGFLQSDLVIDVAAVDEAVIGAVGFAGLAILLVALAGLSAFQARTEPVLAWAAFLLPAVGAIGILIGLVASRALDPDGDGSYPGDVIGGIGAVATLIGSALFGIASLRTGVLSRRGARLLVIAPLVVVTAFVVVAVSWDLSVLLVYVSVIAFIGGWYALGVDAIRTDRPATDPRPI